MTIYLLYIHIQYNFSYQSIYSLFHRYCGFVEEDTHPTTATPLISNSDDLLVIFKSPNASIHADFKFPNASRIGFKLCFNTTFQRETSPISPDDPVSEKSTANVASATFVLIVAVGAVFVIFLVAILIFCLCCKKRKQVQAGSMENVVVTHRNGIFPKFLLFLSALNYFIFGTL